MIELLVPQAFSSLVTRPFPEEGLEARLPVLFDVCKKRVRDLLAVVVFSEGLAAHSFVERDFFRERIHCCGKMYRHVLAMELDLLVDDIVNELALDHELGGEVLEPPDFFGIYNRFGFDIRGDVFKIVLALAPVPDPVFCKRPGIDFKEKVV
jgi:hypothetical protein